MAYIIYIHGVLTVILTEASLALEELAVGPHRQPLGVTARDELNHVVCSEDVLEVE